MHCSIVEPQASTRPRHCQDIIKTPPTHSHTFNLTAPSTDRIKQETETRKNTECQVNPNPNPKPTPSAPLTPHNRRGSHSNSNNKTNPARWELAQTPAPA
ncbi:hypothetical protein VTJ04DRAFT_6215 [Mycothermus thermophilus]|uniref:uncharacterized protein n=1 Tax=Humicola insolens TaxID=85995 RepID=UPI003741F070